MALFCNDNRVSCTSIEKNVFEFEILNANISMFAPCGYDLNLGMKEQAQAHYFGTVLA